MENNKDKRKANDSIVVDYMIALLYVLIVALLFATLVYLIDFMVAYVLPYGVIIAVTLIFVNYLTKILGSIKK